MVEIGDGAYSIVGEYFLKPISNVRINANWSEDMVNAFLRLGEKYPEIAASIYLVAST